MRWAPPAALCGWAVLSGKVAAEDDNTTQEYAAPSVAGLHFAETFDGDVWSRWSHSTHEKYNGKFTVELRKQEALVGDLGLLVPEEARHYGISSSFPPMVGKAEVPFVVQYEVKLQDGLSCGGAYLKLYDSAAATGGFLDGTPYVIMFGPDRCGGTNKVHFILRHRNPKTGAWEEKHFKDAPAVPQDNLSHLYGLIIKPDNSFEVQIDGEQKASGNLLSSMGPAINPPKDIDDPVDKKPEDWIDEAKMDDPASSKPEDWDEEQPMMIDDAAASKPDGWVDDQEVKIPDPSASKPEDWDDDEDGEWEAPVIENPACKVGCGEWKRPRISNPLYKGKWHAPKIDNPDYKGVWRPRQIPNPDYFFDEAPALLPQIDSVGIDIWTMSKSILFDNIVVSDSIEKAKAFADASFKLRREIEEKQQPKAGGGGVLGTVMEGLRQHLYPVIGVSVILVLLLLWCCCAGGGAEAPGAETEEERRARRAKKRMEQQSQKKRDGKDSGDEAEDAGAGDKPETKAKGAASEAERRPAAKKEEGGLGDLAAEDD